MTLQIDRLAITNWLKNQVAEYVQLDSSEIDSHTPLVDYGIDSVHSVNLCGALEDELGVYVDPLLVHDHPTIQSIVDYFSSRRQ